MSGVKHVELSIEYSDEQPKVPPFVAIACIAVVIAVTLRAMPYHQTEVHNDVATTDSWESVLHFAYGAAATSRKEVYPNGSVWYGPLKGGKRHGAWSYNQADGGLRSRSFMNGRQMP